MRTRANCRRLAGKVALEADRLLSETVYESAQAIHDGTVGGTTRHYLDRRHQMRRIGEMGYCDAVFARALSGNDVGRHAGRGAGQYRFGRRDGLKRHKQCLLGFSILGDRFEGEFGIACGGL